MSFPKIMGCRKICWGCKEKHPNTKYSKRKFVRRDPNHIREEE